MHKGYTLYTRLYVIEYDIHVFSCTASTEFEHCYFSVASRDVEGIPLAWPRYYRQMRSQSGCNHRSKSLVSEDGLPPNENKGSRAPNNAFKVFCDFQLGFSEYKILAFNVIQDPYKPAAGYL